jgi:hypothetical protein
MDTATITTATVTLMQGGTPVPFVLSYVGNVATLSPNVILADSTVYTATITTGSKDVAGHPLAANKVWSFTTGTSAAAGPAAVNLGTAGTFVILSKTGISATGMSAGGIVGDIGVSPIDSTAITGFGLVLNSTYATSSLVVGNVYAANYAEPTPTNMTTAIGDMATAYTDAAGRINPTATELGAGDISGMTISPGLYQWGTALLINSSLTLTGGANDIWIFQIASDLTLGSGTIITLSGGAVPEHVFWQVAGQTTLGTTSQFKGIVLCQTKIQMNTGASFIGRALAKTAVTLDSNSVTQP